ncbi:MAG: RluA family pseudouridine synthase [Bacilli bacterium]|nr:RluA family pseudouridine synthase [Bacilli bacterium]
MEIIVKKDGELLDYLVNNTDISRKNLKKYLTHGSIYVNNTSTTKYNYKVVTGNKIFIDTNSKSIKKLPFTILFEDDHIIVVDKPSGLLTMATEKEKTLYHMIREYLVSKDKRNKVFIVHRLDKDTSGVVIFSKDEKTKKLLQNNWNEFVKLREYTLVCHNKLKEDEGRIINYLKETKTKLVYTTSKDKGIEAITNYKVIKSNDKYSLVSVFLETGRRNQIRVAFSSMGNPIVGDKVYGIKDNENRLYLHANRLKIYYPHIKKEILFESKNPIEFKKIMK